MNTNFARGTLFAALTAAAVLTASPTIAGPFILAGTDADDHGFASATANIDGWLFMQRAIENLAPSVTNGSKTVVSLGSDASSTAGNAAASAFAFSNLGAAGWTFVNVNTVAGITAFFSGVGAQNTGNTGIVMLDSGENVGGGLTSVEQAALASNASALNNYLGAGGGLFSQSNDYGFLSALLPGVLVTDEFDTGINLTADGSAAFPGLTNADLNAGPYHASFSNIGSLGILGTSVATGNALIIGAAGGSITDPEVPGGVVPEPATLSMMGLGVLGFLAARRRNRH
ncbi:MAG: PEP-CTERM sorting domain-containing protein [Pseudomonadota bacterium]